MTLEKFKQFTTKPVETVEQNFNVWTYTRVSSKDQEMNKSLSTQKNAAEKCADEKGFIISEIYGGTYESASGDFTRAEFMRLINEVKKAKKKPYAILIFTMSRFSRTGGGGISLADELVATLGVHLIEVSTGKTTETAQGKHDIYDSLLRAYQENIDRLKAIIPGMKAFAEAGGWTGKAPRGYDTYGKRVSRPEMLSHKHRIEMNEEGEKLKLAWQWKLRNERDVDIMRKLENMGVKIYKSAISKIWRNPFYAGICVRRYLDGPVRGNWKPMVTEEEFWKVQDILDGIRKSGYKIEKDNNKRPLNLFLRCIKCGEKMSGYENKRKKLHYYKCQRCNGSSINAHTRPRSRGMGAHDLFRELLSHFQLDETLVEPFREQLKYTYESLNVDQAKEKGYLQRELQVLQDELKELKRNHAFGKVDKELYEEFRTEQLEKISSVSERLEKLKGKISNLEKYVDISVDVAKNLSKYWAYESVASRRRIQDVVFPEGLTVDTVKRHYLTDKINSVFTISGSLSDNKSNKKSDSLKSFLQESPLVARGRLELPTSGL